MDWLNFTIVAFGILLAIAIFLYFRPRFINEGFATHAIDETLLPKCFLRDVDAQELIRQFPKSNDPTHIASLQELTLILQKVLCIDADVSGAGAGVYSTQKLPYATSHDIEPVQSIVNRCVKKAVRKNDLEVIMDKYQARGNYLIMSLCSDAYAQREALVKFHTILVRSMRTIQQACAAPKADMDKPAGPRDPGYYIPDSVLTYSEYKLSGNGIQYI
jgi:hypothetical protein